MKIKRIVNETEYEFELTQDEVRKAYCEQQLIYDKEDIQECVYRELENESISKKEAESILKNDIALTTIATRLRDLVSKDDAFYDVLIGNEEYAVYDYLKEKANE